MSSSTAQRSYSIREAAALTGLPASTLRYYESIGVVAPVGRGESSGHRVYDEQDLDQLMWVACLAATGMSVSDMREYVANGQRGRAIAADQIRLLTEQATRLAAEGERITLRQEYVNLKIDYWRATEAGDDDRAELRSAEARAMAGRLRK